MVEARWYEKIEDQKVRCYLCNHRCLIKEGDRGICFVRQNHQGTLYSLVYGKPIARHVDPIEKKPLFHFYPGTASYSIATAGCNFSCLFCQNADISQAKESRNLFIGKDVLPDEIVRSALAAGCRSISYTYTEPTIFLEYALDIARSASAQGLGNVFVSNGYMTPEALDSLRPHLHARRRSGARCFATNRRVRRR